MERLNCCLICGIKSEENVESREQKNIQNLDILNELLSDPQQLKSILDINLESAFTCEYCQSHLTRASSLLKQIKQIESTVVDLICQKKNSVFFQKESGTDDKNTSSEPTQGSSKSAEENRFKNEKEEDFSMTKVKTEPESDDDDADDDEMEDDEDEALEDEDDKQFNEQDVKGTKTKSLMSIPESYNEIAIYKESYLSFEAAEKSLKVEKLWKRITHPAKQLEKGISVAGYKCKNSLSCPLRRWIFFPTNSEMFESIENKHDHEGGGMPLRQTIHKLINEGDLDKESIYRRLTNLGITAHHGKMKIINRCLKYANKRFHSKKQRKKQARQKRDNNNSQQQQSQFQNRPQQQQFNRQPNQFQNMQQQGQQHQYQNMYQQQQQYQNMQYPNQNQVRRY